MLKWYQKLLCKCVVVCLKLYKYTHTLHIIYHETLNNELPEEFVKLFWHESIFMHLQHPNHTPAPQQVLLNANKLGNFTDYLLRLMTNCTSIRGSARRKKISAVRNMLKLKNSTTPVRLTITPDGSRGPRYKIKKGFSRVINNLEVEIIPCITLSTNCWNFSWDRHILAKPFSKNLIYYGQAIPSSSDDEAIEKAMADSFEEAKVILEKIKNNEQVRLA